MPSMTTVEKIRPPLKKLLVSFPLSFLDGCTHALPMNKIPVPMKPLSNCNQHRPWSEHHYNPP